MTTETATEKPVQTRSPWLRRVVKVLAYGTAAIVILLAITVGLFRLFLPRLPEYQDEIKAWASAAIGMQVDFTGMDARWGLTGPELEFYNAELIRPDSEIRIIAAEEVRVGVGLIRLLADRTLVVDRVVVRNSSIEVRRLEDGSFWIQGGRAGDLLALQRDSAVQPAAIDVIGEQLQISFMQPGDERPQFFDIDRVRISIDERRIAADADVSLPDALGQQITVSALQLLGTAAEDERWDIHLEAEGLVLPGWALMAPMERPLVSGAGDVDMSVAIAAGRVSNVLAEVELTDVALVDETPFNLSGRFEVDLDDNGWLVAANEFLVGGEDQSAPEASLRLETSTDDNGNIIMFDARASYVNLADTALAIPWLPADQSQRLSRLSPSGVVRDFSLTASDLDSEQRRFNVNAELEGIGFSAIPGMPGVQGFSGTLRASQSGGSLQIRASQLAIDATEFTGSSVDIVTAESLLFWRQRGGELSIWSDGLQLSNSFFDSQSDVDLVFRDGIAAPEIALSSTWSILDIAQAKRLIPERLLQQHLYDWFQMSLVSGSIPDGRTELHGPLDKFPFDAGEGQLLINASVRNLDFKYHRDWPASENADLEVVLENARLYSERNRSTSLGNRVVNARVEIADLREPVLTIDSEATGTLESIRQFSLQSPIAEVFGGQLERVSVSGDASFTLDLSIPLKRARRSEFEFESRVSSRAGTLEIAGFDAPISELSGDVTVSRNSISSDSLTAQFLGEPVSINLRRADMPGYSVLAEVAGRLTTEGLLNDLSLPLDDLVDGNTEYTARVLFPQANDDEPQPLSIEIASELEGLALRLPEPLEKSASGILPTETTVQFAPGGERIETFGTASDLVAWRMQFNRPEGAWDLDRGVVSFGGIEVANAETRGLHIRGRAGSVRLNDWLTLSRSGAEKTGAADRIRSIDVEIDNLHLLGQHLESHRLRVDRSARDWLVQFDGEDARGSVFVPYDFGGDRAMVLAMERLRLPGDDTASDTDASALPDPRSLPPIELRAADFAIGDRYLGAVEASIEKTADGLETSVIKSVDDSFEVVANGRWVFDDVDPLGSRTEVTATLSSSDVEATMRRLNYEPGIAGDSMNMLLDLQWSGGPRADFFDVLDGEVQVRFGDGQLQEVEPGAGRMFGLMSIAALPRRLSLDFRDVFSKGFSFDAISGTFRIDDGLIYTCDLALEGPAANVGIVGVADIVERTYEQTAVVSANVGNTLPIVGAVVAGPQAAAALLIFSQIFKKPIQEAGQVYYSIDGGWDEPQVESTSSAAFVGSSERAGCLADAR